MDEKMSKVDLARKALHDLMKAKTLGLPMPEGSAKIMQVHPETLRKVAVDTAAPARGGHSVPTEVARDVTERMKYFKHLAPDRQRGVEHHRARRGSRH